MNLLRAELLKIRTTSTWWVFGIITVPLWALALLFNWGTSSLTSRAGAETGGDPSLRAEQVRAAGEAVNIAANLYTSGQFFGVLIVLMLSAIVVTNEFFHLTATTTFLVTPIRERVILAKLGACVLVGLVFWLAMTVLNLIVAPFMLDQLHVGAHLGDPAIWRAIGLNALAFALWAVLGVGAGVLIRSQLAATITLSITYLVGSSAAGIAFTLLAAQFGDWVAKLQVIVPTSASELMIAGTDLPGNPPRWVGAAVLIGYAVVMGLIGTAITRRRDIS
jgi:ABC-2 type transport system permease protein